MWCCHASNQWALYNFHWLFSWCTCCRIPGRWGLQRIYPNCSLQVGPARNIGFSSLFKYRSPKFKMGPKKYICYMDSLARHNILQGLSHGFGILNKLMMCDYKPPLIYYKRDEAHPHHFATNEWHYLKISMPLAECTTKIIQIKEDRGEGLKVSKLGDLCRYLKAILSLRTLLVQKIITRVIFVRLQ